MLMKLKKQASELVQNPSEQNKPAKWTTVNQICVLKDPLMNISLELET